LKKILIAGNPAQTVHYVNAISALGAKPVVSLHVPNTGLYDGLLLPGGGDIDPVLFGQLLSGSRSIDPALDRLQLAILKAFVLDKKPVLGICKGMQLINIFFGGDIFQHLASYNTHQYQNGDRIHETCALPGSFLHKLYGSRFVVNSAHHQGVDLKGQGIRYVQYCDDGVVEGLHHSFLPVYGVQWHPERMCFQNKRSDTADGSLLLSFFLNQA
jgi:putative glutamine amidotransferase